ncbi:MAG: hypothetical protein SGI87_13380 [Flavobacteriales bacterium]|nr:hypothetical protein [Flavobacteriales bacterium]
METIEHSTAIISLRDDGIIRFQFHKNAVVDINAAFDYVKIIRELSHGIPRAFLLDTRDTFSNHTSEARQYMGRNAEALEFRIADAILVNSLPLRIVGNFYMKFDTPLHPVQIFKQEADAITWLESVQLDVRKFK